jgi:hypothetical protein
VKVELVAVSGCRQGETFAIEGPSPVTFGRTRDSTNRFDGDLHMSSLHFSVEVVNSHEILLRDLRSTNGTWLNQRRVDSSSLVNGDSIRAGTSVFRVEIAGAVSAADNSPPVRPKSDSTIIPRPLHPAPLPGPATPALGPAPVQPAAQPTDPGPSGPAIPVFPRERASSGSSGSSPIESADSRIIRLAGGELPLPPPQVAREKNSNPFSESCEWAAPVVPVAPVPTASQIAAGAVTWLVRRPETEIWQALSVMVDILSQQHSLKLLVHFRKIRVAPPAGVGAMHPLRDWPGGGSLDGDVPLLVDWTAWKNPDFAQFLPRLCRADALMMFLGTNGKMMDRQIDEMLGANVDGFSETGGFLPFCWPTSWMAIARDGGLKTCEGLFGNLITGVLMCSPGPRPRLVAFARQPLADELRRHKFEEFDPARASWAG